LSFLTFLLYFIISSIIYEVSAFIILSIIKFFIERKLKKFNTTEVSMITMDELLEKINKSTNSDEDGEGTWH